MLTVIIVLFVFSLLILIHEAGHLFAAKAAGITVEVFSLGMGKRLCGMNAGGTDYRISLFPFGGYIRMAGEDPLQARGTEDELGAKPPGHRFWVMVSGALTNYVFAFLLFSVIFMMGIPVMSNEVGQILKGYPAEEAGIRVGDEIVSINDIQTPYWDNILGVIKKSSLEEEALRVKVKRGERLRVLDVRLRIFKSKNIFGQTISRPMMGIAPSDKTLTVSYNPLRAVYHGGRHLIMLTTLTYKGIWLLLTGGLPVRTSVAGPIGIFHLIGHAAHAGIMPLMLITAHISMALAIFNLLPIPILDGGHIIFLGLEKLRGRPVSPRVQEIITQVAFVLLLAFILFVSWQDLLKFTPLGGR